MKKTWEEMTIKEQERQELKDWLEHELENIKEAEEDIVNYKKAIVNAEKAIVNAKVKISILKEQLKEEK